MCTSDTYSISKLIPLSPSLQPLLLLLPSSNHLPPPSPHSISWHSLLPPLSLPPPNPLPVSQQTRSWDNRGSPKKETQTKCVVGCWRPVSLNFGSCYNYNVPSFHSQWAEWLLNGGTHITSDEDSEVALPQPPQAPNTAYPGPLTVRLPRRCQCGGCYPVHLHFIVLQASTSPFYIVSLCVVSAL